MLGAGELFVMYMRLPDAGMLSMVCMRVLGADVLSMVCMRLLACPNLRADFVVAWSTFCATTVKMG